MAEVAEIKERIRAFVLELAERQGVTSVKDDDPLTTNDVIDSLGIFRLVSFVEDTFGVKISDDEITNQNFQDLNEISSLVAAKLEEKSSNRT